MGEKSAACMEDYMTWTPQRLRTCRTATQVLQKSALQGFGAHIGLGERYWEGFLRACQVASGMETSECHFRPLPGMAELARRRMKYIGKSEVFNAFVSRQMCQQLHLYRSR